MYFNAPGKENTKATLEAAYKRAQELGVNEIVLASSKGDTAYAALEICKGMKITAVTYHCGFTTPFVSVMKEEIKQDLESKGVRVISATHALSGVERSLLNKYGGGLCPVLIMADTLKLFGQGPKVAVEVSIMATDGGALTGADIIAVGGSGRGADSALVIKPAGQSHVFDMKIREIICKPREF
ncbi:pyruvate kinase alpha/beta domain-containing protein [Desulfatibacillum aliphaticivorans]|uniref:Pyruvate kinase C-terminal domain-containing protein n=1 Tax=Desulfatibacillum aliphaticivorans TaxID=218208 RepID=B8FBE7_DESAL|nr:pyruvate kinase alpha/beta domain-containing protein [Desulfatibacillum aliphaticivorans]ACL04591.1 Protein of unknown function DUF1867 [Desulfatibacillum aliphaticivorans]